MGSSLPLPRFQVVPWQSSGPSGKVPFNSALEAPLVTSGPFPFLPDPEPYPAIQAWVGLEWGLVCTPVTFPSRSLPG
jgi:hypothetical protein